MRVIHLISGGDVGGAKTHVLSLLQGLNQAHRVLLVCFMEGPFAQEAREMGIPTQVLPGWNIPRIICRLEELIRTDAGEELRGVIVDRWQAGELARRLGIVIRE